MKNFTCLWTPLPTSEPQYTCPCCIRWASVHVKWNRVCMWCCPALLQQVFRVHVYLPSSECCREQLTDRMFLWTSSIGPGLWEILSLRSSASRAFFSFSCLACRDGSADVSVKGTEKQKRAYEQKQNTSRRECLFLQNEDWLLHFAENIRILL